MVSDGKSGAFQAENLVDLCVELFTDEPACFLLGLDDFLYEIENHPDFLIHFFIRAQGVAQKASGPSWGGSKLTGRRVE